MLGGSVRVRTRGSRRAVHVWLGVEPTDAVDELLPVTDHVVVIHGRGHGGRLPLNGAPVDTQDRIATLLATSQAQLPRVQRPDGLGGSDVQPKTPRLAALP